MSIASLVMEFFKKNKEFLPPQSSIPDFSKLVPEIYKILPSIIHHLTSAENSVKDMKNIPPALAEGIPLLSSFAQIFQKNKTGVELFFGLQNTPHTILFVFQNTNEIRATGGFIGSVGLATIQNGKLEKFEFQDVYDLDKHLKTTIPVPLEFSEITNRLFLRDSNFSLHFPDSAQRIQWFYEQESGKKVDTIVTINEEFFQWALSVAGPVTAGENVEITAENAIFTIMYLVEGKFFGKGFDGTSPKEFLGKLAPELVQKVLKNISLSDFARLLHLISQKHLLAWSSKPEIQNFFTDFHITGDVFSHFSAKNPQAIKDFFALSFTNIGSNKSDGFIQQNIEHTNIMAKDGTISGILHVTRTHTWGENEEALFSKLFSEFGTSATVGDFDLKNILGKGDNKVFTRIFLPPNIEITNAKGIFSGSVKTTQFPNYTELSFSFPKVPFAESRSIEIGYTLPQKGNILEFTALSQPGMRSQTLTASVLSETGTPVILTNPTLFSGEFLEDKSFLISPSSL